MSMGKGGGALRIGNDFRDDFEILAAIRQSAFFEHRSRFTRGLDRWFIGSAVEQFERLRANSSIFGDASDLLEWICCREFVSPEMLRRQVLVAAARGATVEVPQRLRLAASDHLNADVWASGLV